MMYCHLSIIFALRVNNFDVLLAISQVIKLFLVAWLLDPQIVAAVRAKRRNSAKVASILNLLSLYPASEIQYNKKHQSSMKKKPSPNVKHKGGVDIFSDLMLMRFKPKTSEGNRNSAHSPKHNNNPHTSLKDKKYHRREFDNNAARHLLYLELASENSVILGDYNQLDMIDLQGLTHNFVDTFHYWSLSNVVPILDLKVNIKQQVFLVLSVKKFLLFSYTSYTSTKRQKNVPKLQSTIELKDEVRFMQFSTNDSIALFYEHYFEIYGWDESRSVRKKIDKKYNVNMNRFVLFAVPQSIDNTINIFLQQRYEQKKVFGLWCIEINLLSEKVIMHQPYKIYDIKNTLKRNLILQNYSKEIIFLNLGQEILVAKRGYIVDVVNINIQLSQNYLKYIPNRKLLVHIDKNMMETYSFKINMNVYPHRIELTSIDCMEIVKPRQNSKLIGLLPIFQTNFAIFYEENSSMLTRGEFFYSFMVSYTVSLQDKVNLILAADKSISLLSQEEIQKKCDILRKIGMKDREIYLEIWKKSTKSSVTDYQLLLSTRHYKTIKNQIENKLRKTSLTFKQVYKVQQSCLQILSQRITEQKCDQQDLKDYLTCHLLKRKLDLHKELETLNNTRLNDNDHIFYINIQEYYNLKNMELKQFVLESISQFLFSGKQNIKEIRVIMTHFRFVYRFIYLQLLEEIIKLAKHQLKTLLVALPELLPYDLQETTQAVNQSIWKDITPVEWKNSLYRDNLSNINNKPVVEETFKGVWFKRNWLTMHDVIPLSTTEINLKNQQNNSVEIFYLFIEKVLENIKEIEKLKEVLSHVELRYGQYPQHLKDKVLLYSNIYNYYLKNHELTKLPKIKLAQLLTYKDQILFKWFFDFEKVKKNCLLKQIIPIYQKSVEKGFEVFNQSLFSYFKSDVSEISHLKYLLNRINNEKKEFHSTHESMYYVLVKAMQIKLKLGSDNDIPVDEVLIYIENIPIGNYEHEEMIKQLQIIQKISDESAIFKRMKINMTIREIIDKYEEVIEKLVDYEIEKYEIMKINTKSEIIAKTYRVLAEIQSLKNKLYGEDYNELAFLIYLTRMMQHEQKISFVNNLLNDEYLNKYYYIDLNIIENLVRYMYKWKFSQNTAFLVNAEYIRSLLDLLADDNGFKQFALLELKFAEMLSSKKEMVTYPLSLECRYPRLCELEELIKFMDEDSLRNLNLDEVADTMKKLQEYSKDVFSDSKTYNNQMASINPQKIEDSMLYEVVIKVMITRSMLKEVLPHIKKSIKMTQNYDVITILILIYTIIPELNEDSKILITKITSLLYSHPETLLEIVETVMSGKFTGLQLIKFLKGEYQKYRENYINFNPQNIVFNIYFTHLSQEGNVRQSKRIMVKNILIKLKKIRRQFLHDFLFDFLYVILCYDPQAIAIFLKFVDANKYKMIRNFMSHLIQEEIFDELNILEVMKRVFYYLLKSIKENIDIYSIVRQFGQISLLEEFRIKNYQELSLFERKIEKNVLAFQKKKAKVYKLERSQRMKNLNYILVDKQVSIRQSMRNLDELKDKQVNQYIFSDSDDDYQPEEEEKPIIPLDQLKRTKIDKIFFDPMSERKKFYKRKKGENPQTNAIEQPNIIFPVITPDVYEDKTKECLEKGSKSSRVYFGNDVRSGYNSQQNQSVYSGVIEKSHTNSKQSLAVSRQHFERQNAVDHIKSAAIIPSALGDKQKRDLSPQNLRKNVQMNAVNRSFDESMLLDHDVVSPKVQSKKLQQQKSQQNETIINSVRQLLLQSQRKNPQIQTMKKNEQILIQNEVQAINEKEQVNSSREEPKAQQSPIKVEKVSIKAQRQRQRQRQRQAQKQRQIQGQRQSQIPSLNRIRSDQEIKIKQSDDEAQSILKKIYKTFSPRLEVEPYNLRALTIEQGQNAKNFKSLLRKVIEEVYHRPDKSFQIALKLIQQIAKKYPELNINMANAEAYQRIAKCEAKYGLDLPLQKMLPLRGLFLKKQNLFESIKENILEVCDHQNLFKISKLISIGLKKNTLELQIVIAYLQKIVKDMRKLTDNDDQNFQLEKIKALANRLTGKVLVEKAQQFIKLVEDDAELKRRIVNLLSETIKMKGNEKEARELAKKYK